MTYFNSGRRNFVAEKTELGSGIGAIGNGNDVEGKEIGLTHSSTNPPQTAKRLFPSFTGAVDTQKRPGKENLNSFAIFSIWHFQIVWIFNVGEWNPRRAVVAGSLT